MNYQVLYKASKICKYDHQSSDPQIPLKLVNTR